MVLLSIYPGPLSANYDNSRLPFIGNMFDPGLEFYPGLKEWRMTPYIDI